jgi:hypothetical protein
MTYTKLRFAAVTALGAMLFAPSEGQLGALDADTSYTVVAAQTAKQQCMSACRARYRDCRRLNQLSPFECKDIYQDCTQYSCTGLGPG